MLLDNSHKRSLAVLCPILLALPAAPAFAQGADDCANALPIFGTGVNGTGVFSLAGGATDSPQQTGVCPPAHQDKWFLWTPVATDTFTVSTCVGSADDTVLAVYQGPACPAPGTQIACDDDTCGIWGVASVVIFTGFAGSSYLIQIGSALAGTGVSGTFSIVGNIPPPPCGPNTGPDLIVGDLQDIANYSGQSIGGVDYDAVAFGTYACNIGTVWVSWVGAFNLHPVIANNLYKYKVVGGSGRMEQIGMSWLQHTSAPLANSLCCNDCQPSDADHLGVHCADPRSALRNGTQASLRPRWQANGAVGVFPFPGANPGFSGTVARRCQVRASDLEPSGSSVHYFGEAQYVTQDDAFAGNDNNNASYREISVTGSGTAWDFALLAGSSTVSQSPAIRAWQALDSSVRVANIDIVGDGRVVLAWRVTDLGGGQWHYEYALFNLNSDRSIRALSVPQGVGVVLSNIGFHDVDYHDGDGPGDVNFDGTDWPATIGAASLDWATSTLAQNPSANALRWGTLYNFRFDANAGPISGTLTLSTFKIVGSVTVSADVPGIPQFSAFCFGDGTGPVACPCNNSGAPGHGCANSQNAAGAQLSASGTTTPDTLALTSSGELPTALSILLQGDVDLATPVIFGDGLRCLGGGLVRLYAHGASGGVVVFPPVGALSISAQSAFMGDPIAPGTTRSYLSYFRDSNPNFCAPPTGSGFNASNAQRVLW